MSLCCLTAMVKWWRKVIGRNGKLFKMYKFRSMFVNAPDIRLADGSTYNGANDPRVTKIGKFIRAASIDELPQILNILNGTMSLIGPRPALWNQEDLIAERDKYGANDVRPGLTGWAQVNGRDVLYVEDKARYDGEYVAHITFGMDMKCLWKTVTAVLTHRGFREGEHANEHRTKEE